MTLDYNNLMNMIEHSIESMEIVGGNPDTIYINREDWNSLCIQQGATIYEIRLRSGKLLTINRHPLIEKGTVTIVKNEELKGD